ncbi:MAG: aldehyde dehydrogenase family protein [Fimbriimonadaceae bacterium]|nr:aldehyde dehydrogenase family protein [Fimbriimonadaceae bacterium]
MATTPLTQLTAGMPLLVDGDRLVTVPPALADAFQPGDRLLVVAGSGDLLHIPAAEREVAAAAVGRAASAFAQMGAVSDAAITAFYAAFAARLADDAVWAAIAAANAADVARAQERGRSTTRLLASDKLRADMISGLQQWQAAPSQRGRVLEAHRHQGWTVQQVTAPLGVVGFVFEGRPNVFADATGVLRGGNTVVFRIGSDALGTARAIVAAALDPALAAAGLPAGAASLVDSASHAAGWAMFSDRRLALAVARGSGRAVAQLGSVARQAGVAVSLHGTGGAWLLVDASADPQRLEAVIYHSLDRKVCNTLNTLSLPADRIAELLPVVLAALERAGQRRGHGYRLHLAAGGEGALPAALFDRQVLVRRAGGEVVEPLLDILPVDQLSREWEWEETPELSLVVVPDLDTAIELYNCYSPQFVASLLTQSEAAFERFYALTNAPFVGDGFTRWVDGQYALNRPELGLSNWEAGRLFARGGILSGDGVYTVRTVVRQSDHDLHR